jgi:hypothetical protein
MERVLLLWMSYRLKTLCNWDIFWEYLLWKLKSLLPGSDQVSRNKIQQWEWYEMPCLRHCPLLVPAFHFCWPQHLYNSGPSSLNECRNCDLGSGKGKEMYLLFRMKELTNFAFALFAKSTCCFLLVSVSYYQMGKKFTEGRFCPRRFLTTEAATVKYFHGE